MRNTTGRSSSAALWHESLQQQQQEGGSRTSSLRVYYNDSASGAIPFKWESAPGTPIHSLSSSSTSSILPPLTPPPSFFHRSSTDTSSFRPKPKLKFMHESSRPTKLLTYLLQKLVASKKKILMSARHVSPLSSSSSPSLSGSSAASYNSIGSSMHSCKMVGGGYLRVGRLCGLGSSYTRPRSPLHCDGEFFDDHYGVVRTLSFESRSVDSGVVRFDDDKKKGFRGCFGL